MKKLISIIVMTLTLMACSTSTLMDSAVLATSYADLDKNYDAAHKAVLSVCPDLSLVDCGTLKVSVSTIDTLVSSIERLKNMGDLSVAEQAMTIDDVRTYFYFSITAWADLRTILDGKVDDPVKKALLLRYDADIEKLSESMGNLIKSDSRDYESILNSLIKMVALAAKTAALF